MNTYHVYYITSMNKKGAKKFYGDTKEEVRLKFKYLYPDYLILKISESELQEANKMCDLCGSQLYLSSGKEYKYFCSVCGSYFNKKL